MSGILGLVGLVVALGAGEAPRPNVLWITCEDLSSWIGCFGDAQAVTPNIDRLARDGVRYREAFATAPVCSPARSCLILGMYASSTGSQNLRSHYGLPAQFPGFPSYLRNLGYYTTNNVKTDYNTSEEKRTIGESWDESGPKAHWRRRRAGQPFFAVFNLMQTHQSKGGFFDPAEYDRPLAPGQHDPARMKVPPYYPDTPIVRQTLAHYYDRVTEMDRSVGQVLGELAADGLAEDTIVFFYPDHGTGLPRGKRTVYDSGLKVPLVVRVPTKFRQWAPAAAGATCDRLVSFVDFAPTVLSLVGLAAPANMQGQAFLGAHAQAPRQSIYGARDRVDEAIDMARAVRDRKYLYIRNYYPQLSWNAPERFSDQAPMRREITRLAAEGRLDAAQMTYAGPGKPAEALFDTEADPHQLHNLAGRAGQREVLERMRAALRSWLLEIRDTGFMPEEDLEAVTAAGGTPWELARDAKAYPLERVLAAAELVGRPGAEGRQVELLADPCAAVRFWAVNGLSAAAAAARDALPALRQAMRDGHPAVRIVAAGAVANLAGDAEALDVLVAELKPNTAAGIRAARTLEFLGEKARPATAAMSKALAANRQAPGVLVLSQEFAVSAALEKLGEPLPAPPARAKPVRGKARAKAAR